jgi:asparagine synthase (glutamine-hydrolysing)
MAHSLEARCPLLDHRVIELAALQPSWRHGSATATKQMFRKLVARWLPPEVLARPKMGFGVPLRRWFGEGLIGWAREILLDRRARERGWTDHRETARLLHQHEIGARDHAKRIWALVALELWARRHLDSELPRAAVRDEVRLRASRFGVTDFAERGSLACQDEARRRRAKSGARDLQSCA